MGVCIKLLKTYLRHQISANLLTDGMDFTKSSPAIQEDAPINKNSLWLIWVDSTNGIISKSIGLQCHDVGIGINIRGVLSVKAETKA